MQHAFQSFNSEPEPQDDFLFISKDILFLPSKKVSAKMKTILAVIDNHSREREYCSLTNAEIAKLIYAKSTKYISENISDLIKLGYLSISGNKKRKLTINIPKVIKGIDLVIPHEILISLNSYEFKIVASLEKMRIEQAKNNRKYSVQTLSKYAGISSKSFYCLRNTIPKFRNLHPKIQEFTSQNSGNNNININRNIIEIDYINIIKYILDGFSSIQNCLESLNSFDPRFSDSLEKIDNSIKQFSDLIENNSDSKKNNSAQTINNSDSRKIVSISFEKENSLKNNKNNNCAPAQNNVQEKKKIEHYSKELEEEIFKFNCFTHHKNHTQAYKNCMNVITALKTGTLRTIINISKAYEKQILGQPKKFQYHRPINMSQFEDILTKKYSFKERKEIYAKIANIFDIRYEPKNKESLSNRKSFAALCSNQSEINVSWLVEILVFGNREVDIYKKTEYAETSTEKKLVRKLSTSLVPYIVNNLDLQKDYLRAIRETHEVWVDKISKDLYGNCVVPIYSTDFESFMMAFVNYVYSSSPNWREVKPSWFYPNSYSMRNFISSLIKNKNIDLCFDEDEIDPSSDDFLRKCYHRQYGVIT